MPAYLDDTSYLTTRADQTERDNLMYFGENVSSGNSAAIDVLEDFRGSRIDAGVYSIPILHFVLLFLTPLGIMLYLSCIIAF